MNITKKISITIPEVILDDIGNCYFQIFWKRLLPNVLQLLFLLLFLILFHIPILNVMVFLIFSMLISHHLMKLFIFTVWYNITLTPMYISLSYAISFIYELQLNN